MQLQRVVVGVQVVEVGRDFGIVRIGAIELVVVGAVVRPRFAALGYSILNAVAHQVVAGVTHVVRLNFVGARENVR